MPKVSALPASVAPDSDDLLLLSEDLSSVKLTLAQLVTYLLANGVGSGSGTVTSVAATVPSFLSLSGSPITTTGTLSISLSGTALPAANGGTGLTALGSGVATFLGAGTLPGSSLTGAYTAAALTMATARLLGRTTASSGAAEEISIGSGLSLSAGSLTATGSGGTVTATGGSLTSNSLALGAGTTDLKVVAGFTTDGTSRLQLGVAGTSVGGLELRNATSGTMSLVPPTGALGTTVLTGLAASDTLVGLAATQTLTNKTLTSPTLTTPVLGTPASGNLSACTADGTNAVGFRHIPQNSQSAAYTTVLADAGKHILHPAADTNARTFTIDSNANVAHALGTAITFVNETSQVVSIAITSDTLTLAGSTTTGTRSLAQNGVATALKVTTTKWIISGTGLT